ncbi:MAG: manganese efflux pump [Clostridia bacterium]|nr:manganese efflux pump [Clostridia bacterium]
MNLLAVIFLGIGLSMDAFAVSISSGMLIRNPKISTALKIGFCFGFFQAFMPVIGWLAAGNFTDFISGYDRLIALVLLSFIGCKMIYEGVFKSEDEFDKDISNNLSLLILGIATSIDALMVGVTFTGRYFGIEILTPALIIGITTFLMSFSGVFFGKKFGSMFGHKSVIAGGIILIIIGIKIFFF